MANRAFRRMIERRRAYLNYPVEIYETEQPPELEEEVVSELAELVSEPQEKPIQYAEVQIDPMLNNEAIKLAIKLSDLEKVWDNYKKLFYERIESDDERFDELFEYHRTIEKILSEKS